jgi:hypothetical protein
LWPSLSGYYVPVFLPVLNGGDSVAGEQTQAHRREVCLSTL